MTAVLRGRRAEASAADFLLGQGFALVERNYRCRMGEIDLVMRDGDTLVFVEVRSRRSSSHGSAAASIGTGKRRRILLAARHYLLRWGGRNPPVRFDVVTLDGGGPPMWIRSAFDAEGEAW